MTKVMLIAVELEDDQETPEVGAYGDFVNNDWSFLDCRVFAVVPSDQAISEVRKVL